MTVATMLMVLSGLCLMSAFVWRGATPVTAPVGAMAAVATSFLTVPPGPLVVPVTVATGMVAAFGLATAFGVLHPPTPHHR